MRKLITGLAMVAVCIVLMLLFAIPSYRNYYANTPALYLTVTALGIVFSIAGSYILRDAWFGGVKKDGALPKLSAFFGDFVVIAGVLAGLISLYGAVILGMVSGHWGWNWGERYYFGYHVNSAANFNISLLCVSIVTIIIGQLLIGLGHRRTGAGG